MTQRLFCRDHHSCYYQISGNWLFYFSKGCIFYVPIYFGQNRFFGDLKKSDALYKYEIYSDQMETVFQTTIYAEQTITQGKHSYSVWVRKDHRILKAAPHAIDQAIDACEEHWEKPTGILNSR